MLIQENLLKLSSPISLFVVWEKNTDYMVDCVHRYLNESVQNCSIFIANALEILQFSTMPLIWYNLAFTFKLGLFFARPSKSTFPVGVLSYSWQQSH